MVKSGVIGEVRDVEACFTRITTSNLRELTDTNFGGSFTELGSYTLLPIVKLLGTKFNDIRFESFLRKTDWMCILKYISSTITPWPLPRRD